MPKTYVIRETWAGVVGEMNQATGHDDAGFKKTPFYYLTALTEATPRDRSPCHARLCPQDEDEGATMTQTKILPALPSYVEEPLERLKRTVREGAVVSRMAAEADLREAIVKYGASVVSSPALAQARALLVEVRQTVVFRDTPKNDDLARRIDAFLATPSPAAGGAPCPICDGEGRYMTRMDEYSGSFDECECRRPPVAPARTGEGDEPVFVAPPKRRGGS